MPLSKDRITYLLKAWTSRKATPEEEEELFDWVVESGDENPVEKHIKELVKEYTGKEPLPAVEWENLYEHILEKRSGEAATVSRKIFPWRRIAVAASVVGLLLVAGYWFFSRESSKVRRETPVAVITHDVKAPTVARATLKLADGKIVYLDSVGNGQLAMQGNVSVVKLADGKISYQSAVGSEQLAVTYNTISNPRGSKVQALTLIDGTQVWLNAESSITYPTAFAGNERKVSITGEADFVVKHNEKMPFKVIANGIEVRDIGTEFNVNAYNDEDAIRVTLLEGSVVVSRESGVPDKSGQAVRIKPGEQAYTVSSGQLAINKDVDVEQVMAWKNGMFSFKSADVRAVMRQISRWYDVDVNFEGNVPNETITGDIPRDVNVSQVMKMLEFAGLKFNIDGKKVTVLQ